MLRMAQYVAIDDRLPVDDADQLLFGSCVDANELWVPLAEKAFAKLTGCYEVLADGSATSG